MKLKVPASFRVIGQSFVDWWDSWIDMVLVTILWILAQVTVVLGPPATFGYYYVVSQMMKGESLGVRGLIQGARKYFGKSWQWGAVNLLAIVILIVNFQFYGAVKFPWGFFLQVVIAVMAYLYIATNFYGLPYFMAIEPKSFKVAFKNGLLTTLASPFFTIVVFILSILIIILSAALVLPFFLGLPGVIPILGFRSMNDRLVSFGLREREKTPKEIEMEQGGRIFVQGKEIGPDEENLDAEGVAPRDKKGDGPSEP